ncbi:MAG: hypothetical protein NPIRA05_01430 [Nitrospirales bacterium]|nr:MAG: hypothetical protein NPIRA05_01430 [Nitrospirales bacterium]
MCREEGGVTIFEKIPLTRTEYENYSRGRDYINIPIEGSTLNPDFPYFNRNNTFTINESKPRVERREYMILRKSDQQLMSQSIRFSRVAGVSWLGIPFTGGFSCRQVDGVTTSIETSIDSEIFDIIGE